MILRLIDPEGNVANEETTSDKKRIIAYDYRAQVLNREQGLEDEPKKWRYERVEE